MRKEEEREELDGGEIPEALLPPGFLETLVGGAGSPPPPRPAATVVLLRDAVTGPEVLLLKRVRSSGFVPGAFVFPGGRVDREDADGGVLARVEGLTPQEAEKRLGLPAADPPAIAYYLAAAREAFEETGLWPGDGLHLPPSAREVAEARQALMGGEIPFLQVLELLGLRVPASAMEYIAHWVTPEVEPRRYDTRFFAAVVPGGGEAVVDPREMSSALWVTPEGALDRNLAGELPMVFPTLHTLRALTGGRSVEELMDRFRGRPVPRILPRLVRTPTGVGLRIPR